MTAVAIGLAHIKVGARDGERSLERCEDGDCLVDEQGRAGCGRVACPSCGCSGGNLILAGDMAACECGHAWPAAP
jgi:hypothetical protein